LRNLTLFRLGGKTLRLSPSCEHEIGEILTRLTSPVVDLDSIHVLHDRRSEHAGSQADETRFENACE